MASPVPIHCHGIKRIRQYLGRTTNFGLTYSTTDITLTDSHSLRGWNDADWVVDINTKKSSFGYDYQIDSTWLISWQSQKQSIVAISSTEAEYIAVATTTKEMIWIQTLI